MTISSLKDRVYLCDMTEHDRIKRALLSVNDTDFRMYYSTWENVLMNHLEPYKYVTGIENDPMFELMQAKF
jgi:hypothetical protein